MKIRKLFKMTALVTVAACADDDPENIQAEVIEPP